MYKLKYNVQRWDSKIITERYRYLESKFGEQLITFWNKTSNNYIYKYICEDIVSLNIKSGERIEIGINKFYIS